MINMILSAFRKSKEYFVILLLLLFVGFFAYFTFFIDDYFLFVYEDIIGGEIRNRLISLPFEQVDDNLLNNEYIVFYYKKYDNLYVNIDQYKRYKIDSINFDKTKTTIEYEDALHLNEVVISNDLLNLFELQIGDEYTIEFDDSDYDVVIKDVIKDELFSLYVSQEMIEKIALENNIKPSYYNVLIDKYENVDKLMKYDIDNDFADISGINDLEMAKKMVNLIKKFKVVALLIIVIVIFNIMKNYLLNDEKNIKLYKYIGFRSIVVLNVLLVRLLIVVILSFILLFLASYIINLILSFFSIGYINLFIKNYSYFKIMVNSLIFVFISTILSCVINYRKFRID